MGNLVGVGAPTIVTGFYKCPVLIEDYTPCHFMAFVVGRGTV